MIDYRFQRKTEPLPKQPPAPIAIVAGLKRQAFNVSSSYAKQAKDLSLRHVMLPRISALTLSRFAHMLFVDWQAVRKRSREPYALPDWTPIPYNNLVLSKMPREVKAVYIHVNKAGHILYIGMASEGKSGVFERNQHHYEAGHKPATEFIFLIHTDNPDELEAQLLAVYRIVYGDLPMYNQRMQ